MSDFKVLRGTAVIPSGATSLTLVDGVDYTLETGIAADAWFFQIANNRFTGMGRTASGGSQNSDDVTVSISHVANNTILTRDGAANNCRVDWQIVQYTGGAGGLNEFKVREKGVASGATATATIALPGTVADAGDVVPFITAQRSNGTGRNNYNRGLFTSEISGGDAIFDRFTTVGTFTLSYALVEFVGSNWTISNEQFDNPSVSANTDQAVNLAAAISAVAQTFLHCTYRYETTGTVGLDDASNRVRLLSTTQLSVLDATATDDTLKKNSVWLIQNPDMTVARYTGTMAGTGEEEVVDVAVTEVGNLDLSFTTLSNDSTGGGTAFPRGLINHILQDASTVRLRQSDNGQTSDYSIEVVELPEGSSGGSATVTPADADHAHISDSPSLTAASSASPADASSAHLAGSPSLSSGSDLAPADALHPHAAASPTITVKASITIQSADHAHDASAPSLSIGATVIPDGSQHDITSTSPVIGVAGSVAPSDAVHDHTAGSPAIATASTITTATGDHAHAASAPVIAAGSSVTIDAALHVHIADQPATGVADQVSPAGSSHAHLAGSPSLSSASDLAPANAFHPHSAGSPAISAKASVAPAVASHTQLATSPSISFIDAVLIDGAGHSLTSSEPSIQPRSTASPQSASHSQSVTAITLSARATLSPVNALHSLLSDQANVTEADPLVPHITFTVKRREMSFAVAANDRSFTVNGQSRAFELPPAPRSFSVPAQSRTFIVPEEARE